MKFYEYATINDAATWQLDEAGAAGWEAYGITQVLESNLRGFSNVKKTNKYHMKREIFPPLEKEMD